MTDDLIKRLRRNELRIDQGINELCGSAADALEAQAAEIARLRGTLSAYTEYCNICHSRGSIIEEDEVTGADLWRDCPGCTPARAALEAKP